MTPVHRNISKVYVVNTRIEDTHKVDFKGLKYITDSN
jgi:hypothetical protein